MTLLCHDWHQGSSGLQLAHIGTYALAMVGRSTLVPQVPVSDNDLIVESKSQARFLPSVAL
jgi:hypothetical protein